MRKHYYLIEKLLLFLFYIESMVIMEADHKHYFWLVCILVAYASLRIEGARPYTPVFVMIFIADMLNMEAIQVGFVVVLGFLMVYLKFYHIQIVGKGPYNSGYRTYRHKDILIGIFYPSTADGSHCKWIPTQTYTKAFYEIVFVDPMRFKLPFFIFKFIMSFIGKVKMPVLGDASLYTNDSIKDEKWKVVVFSHGLGSNMNNFSCVCGWWASHGYIVIAVQHEHDTVRIEFQKQLVKQPDILEKIFYDKRNEDLLVRAEEYESVLQEVIRNNLLAKVFGQVEKKIMIEEVYLAGQSYGGATVLQTMANLVISNKVYPAIKGLICLDAWFFPLSNSTYQNLKNQNILLLNSQSFFKVVPPIYYMQQKMKRIRDSNISTLKAFMVKKTDHISTSDFAFVLGNIMKIMKTVKLQEHTVSVMEFHEIVISLFMEGKKSKQILEVSNKYAKESGLIHVGVCLQEEWRYQSKRLQKQ